MSATINGPFDLGTLPGGSNSVALGCSSDGSVIVGYSDDATGFFHAFRWTAGGGMVDLGFLPGDVASFATCVSGDGSVVAGYSDPDNSLSNGFRWTAGGGMVDLGGGAATQALCITKDGLTIAGTSGATHSSGHLFTYTTLGGLADHGAAPHATGGTFGTAISADGNTVAGGNGATSGGHAFKWRAGGGGFTDMGIRPGANFSASTGITGDGSLICGQDGFASLPSETQAWFWTVGGGFDDTSFPLNDINPDAGASCITPDGSTVAGFADLLVGEHIVAWYGTSQFGGLAVLGLPQFSTGPGSNTNALGISDDGLVIVGSSGIPGTGNHAVFWTVTPPSPPPASAMPAPLPVPSAYPMPKVPPQIICLASHSHAAGGFYGPHAGLPRP